MKQSAIFKHAFLHAVGAAIYIALVALLGINAEALFGSTPGVLGIVAFLFTFVISAAIMGLLVFGRPIIWYLNGAKKEAITLALGTVGFLVLIAAMLFFGLAARMR